MLSEAQSACWNRTIERKKLIRRRSSLVRNAEIDLQESWKDTAKRNKMNELLTRPYDSAGALVETFNEE